MNCENCGKIGVLMYRGLYFCSKKCCREYIEKNKVEVKQLNKIAYQRPKRKFHLYDCSRCYGFFKSEKKISAKKICPNCKKS